MRRPNFLTNGYYIVEHENVLYNTSFVDTNQQDYDELTLGVLQGSIFGLLLFFIYINRHFSFVCKRYYFFLDS